jgi:predicted nucleic acid-binding protein
LTEATHDQARRLAERYPLSFYDALIVAAALQSQCTTLYSEAMQEGFLIEKRLSVRNPLAPQR